MDKPFKSVAWWIKDGIETMTDDNHWTEDEAQSVCDRLIRDYNRHSPCKYRGVCFHAEVRKTKGTVIDGE